ncbi:MAG: cytochrome c oxidase assembly protein [Solirubrobacteraceae bacterium]
MTFAPLQLAPATIAGVLYAVRAHHLAQRGKAVALRRQCCFYGGLALIVVSLTSLGDLAGETFVAHMSEHLLIGDLAPLLLVLGLTGPLLAPLLRLRLLGPLRMLPSAGRPAAVGVWHVRCSTRPRCATRPSMPSSTACSSCAAC